MKPFDLEKALAGEPVITRNRKEVSEIFQFKTVRREANLIAIIGGEWYPFHPDGSFSLGNNPSDMDLFMAPIKRQEWVNILYVLDKHHPNGQYYEASMETFDSEQSALHYVEKHGIPNYMKTVLIREWEE